MPHSLALGRRHTGDIRHHRLGHVVANELRRFLFSGAANFANHHNCFSGVVILEQTQDVDKVRARNGVSTNAHAGRLPVAHISGLLNRLVGQRARPGDNANATGQVDVSRHDADLAFSRGDHAGAVRANQTHTHLVTLHLGVQHIERGHTLGNTDNQLNARVGGLENGIFAKRRRHVDH